MPKRNNPFGECSPLQMKSHIRMKDLDKREEGSMRSVYEKTKAMLFEGSRKNQDQCDASTFDDLRIPRQSPPHLLPGQLRLDSQGTICGKAASISEVKENSNSNPSASMDIETDDNSNTLPAGQMVLDFSGKIQRNKGNSKTSLPQCCTCNHHNNTQQLIGCPDCGRYTCSSCVQHCYQCELAYCQFCTKPNPQDYLERALCFRCATQMCL